MHTLYCGVTMSGKTTLARMIARELCKAKKRVIVYDPLGTATAGGDWGDTAVIYESADALLDFLESDEGFDCHVFIDEAHHIFSHEQSENFWLLTQGRHYHLHLHIITQRQNKVHPDVRTNCGLCYMFRLSNVDAKAIGADYGHSDLDKISLDKGDFLILNSGSAQFSRANVFNLLKE